MKPQLAHIPALLALSLVTQATAQMVLVVENTGDTVMEFDATTGALVQMTFMDLRALTSGAMVSPVEIIETASGELWVSDQTSDAIFRFSGDGSTYLGASGGFDNPRGLAPSGSGGAVIANGGLFGATPGPSIIEVGTTGSIVSSAPFSDPFDVEPFTFGGIEGYLVFGSFSHDIIFVNGTDLSTQTLFNSSSGGLAFVSQGHVGMSGSIFVALPTFPYGIYEYDSQGARINHIITSGVLGSTAPNGVVELLNGNLLFTTNDGVYIYDRSSGVVTTEVAGVSGRFATMLDSGGIGTSYCQAETNSTGATGTIAGVGSSLVTANDLTLVASHLPTHQFGIFQTSRTQGFDPMFGGTSNGNLCLGGVLGSYAMPPQIQYSGTGGTFSLTVDLSALPEGAVTVAAVAGDTWNFQAWYRDSVGLGSNFTDGVSITFH